MGKDFLTRKRHTNIRYQSIRKGQLKLSTRRIIFFHNPESFQINKGYIHRRNTLKKKKLVNNSIHVITQGIKECSRNKNLIIDRMNMFK